MLQDKESASGTSSSGASGTTSCEDLPGASADRDCLDFRSRQRTEERTALEDPIGQPVATEGENPSKADEETTDTLPSVDHEAESTPLQESSDLCYFCGQRVYLIDRLSAEGHFFHR